MYLAHPLGVAVRQIVVDRDDVDALALQGVQVCRERGYQGLTFTGAHLSDTSLVQDNAADDLHAVRLQTDRSLRRLAHCRKCLRQEVVQRLALRQTLFIFIGFRTKLLIRQRLHRRTQGFHLVYQRFDALQLMLTVGSK